MSRAFFVVATVLFAVVAILTHDAGHWGWLLPAGLAFLACAHVVDALLVNRGS